MASSKRGGDGDGGGDGQDLDVFEEPLHPSAPPDEVYGRLLEEMRRVLVEIEKLGVEPSEERHRAYGRLHGLYFVLLIMAGEE